jgi:hypothetical protein
MSDLPECDTIPEDATSGTDWLANDPQARGQANVMEPPVPRTGRYAGIAPAAHIGTDRRPIVYLTRRFLPDPAQLVLVQEHLVRPGERLDHIAAQHFGDPELFWRICDADRVMNPAELAEPGRRLRITLASELSAGGDWTISA